MTNVPIAQLAVSDDPRTRLVAAGLGSCVALVVCGTTRGGRPVAALAHVLLPERSAARAHAGADPAKFAHDAVRGVIRELRRAGARPETLRAALVGGARMFEFGSGRDIGERNGAALTALLEQSRVELTATDLGGRFGRSVAVEVGTGRVLVRRSGGSERELTNLAAPVGRPYSRELQRHGTRSHRR